MWDTYNWNIEKSQIKTQNSTQNNKKINVIKLEKEIKKVKFWTPLISFLIAIVTSIIGTIIYENFIKIKNIKNDKSNIQRITNKGV